jgi:hypothetical protein
VPRLLVTHWRQVPVPLCAPVPLAWPTEPLPQRTGISTQMHVRQLSADCWQQPSLSVTLCESHRACRLFSNRVHTSLASGHTVLCHSGTRWHEAPNQSMYVTTQKLRDQPHNPKNNIHASQSNQQTNTLASHRHGRHTPALQASTMIVSSALQQLQKQCSMCAIQGSMQCSQTQSNVR